MSKGTDCDTWHRCEKLFTVQEGRNQSWLTSSTSVRIAGNFRQTLPMIQKGTMEVPKNSVCIINLQIQTQLPGSTTSYRSIDSVADVDESVQYPVGFLHWLEPSGMPHAIEASILTGCAKGEDVFLPRVPTSAASKTLKGRHSEKSLYSRSWCKNEKQYVLSSVAIEESFRQVASWIKFEEKTKEYRNCRFLHVKK